MMKNLNSGWWARRFDSWVRAMAQKLIVAALFYAATPAFTAAGSGALMIIDLASAREWTLSIDDGPARGIIVPGAGFNSDRQEPPWIEMCGDGNGQRMVKDHVVYERRIGSTMGEGKVFLLIKELDK